MIKKTLFASILTLTVISAVAQEQICQRSDTTIHQITLGDELLLSPLEPTYLKNESEADNWGRNWFIEMKGGASALLGSPIGCGDVFDRLTPMLQVGVGKWFTPTIGGRLSYQGLSFKNAAFQTMDYHFMHADLLYNLTAHVNQNDLGLSRWDVIPYVGIGMIHNSDWPNACLCSSGASGSHPFAFSYGLEVRRRLTNRLQLVAELSGMTTSKNFDGIGTSSRFGDNMLSLSAGLSISLGKVGYTRTIDAKPYLIQNEWLIERINGLQNQNRTMRHQLHEDEALMAEYRKILEIEGLLDLYSSKLQKKGQSKTLYPKNDYSGLNSLRARLRSRYGSDDSDSANRGNNDDRHESSLNTDLKDKESIDIPIYFFFHINTCRLTEASQIVNIEEITSIAKKYDLKIKVIGAADSQTGSEERNQVLSQERANYIAKLLTDRGISKENITTDHEGGIDTHSPIEANRHTCVVLSFD